MACWSAERIGLKLGLAVAYSLTLQNSIVDYSCTVLARCCPHSLTATVPHSRLGDVCSCGICGVPGSAVAMGPATSSANANDSLKVLHCLLLSSVKGNCALRHRHCLSVPPGHTCLAYCASWSHFFSSSLPSYSSSITIISTLACTSFRSLLYRLRASPPHRFALHLLNSYEHNACTHSTRQTGSLPAPSH